MGSRRDLSWQWRRGRQAGLVWCSLYPERATPSPRAASPRVDRSQTAPSQRDGCGGSGSPTLCTGSRADPWQVSHWTQCSASPCPRRQLWNPEPPQTLQLPTRCVLGWTFPPKGIPQTKTFQRGPGCPQAGSASGFRLTNGREQSAVRVREPPLTGLELSRARLLSVQLTRMFCAHSGGRF